MVWLILLIGNSFQLHSSPVCRDAHFDDFTDLESERRLGKAVLTLLRRLPRQWFRVLFSSIPPSSDGYMSSMPSSIIVSFGIFGG
jgi:hypothetical protein